MNFEKQNCKITTSRLHVCQHLKETGTNTACSLRKRPAQIRDAPFERDRYKYGMLPSKETGTNTGCSLRKRQAQIRDVPFEIDRHKCGMLPSKETGTNMRCSLRKRPAQIRVAPFGFASNHAATTANITITIKLEFLEGIFTNEFLTF